MLQSVRISRKAVRASIFFLSLIPFLMLARGVATGSLGPDPADQAMHITGEWALRFFVLVLLATPLAKAGWPGLVRYRRMLGLYVLFYATLHLLLFGQVYVAWSPSLLVEELAERPYISVGSVAWLILVALGISSAHFIRKKMGRFWRRFHRLTYVAAVLAVLHLFWLSRSDVGEALAYGVIVGLLLIYRLYLKSKWGERSVGMS